jgi:hypothetical protein
MMPLSLRLPHLDPNRPHITIRERLRCATARLLPRSTAGHRKGGGTVLHVDPAFAAIEECRDAWKAYGDALTARDSVGYPESEKPGPLKDAAREAMEEWREAWEQVQATQPTTLAGAAALASYMVESVHDQGSLDVGDKALEALAARLREMAEARGQKVPFSERAKAFAATTAKILHLPKRHRNEGAKSAHPDQVLLDWGAKFDAQRAFINAMPDDDEGALDEESDVLSDIERVIGSMRPTTLEGLAVKARVAELYAGRLFDPIKSNVQALALAGLVDSVLTMAEQGADLAPREPLCVPPAATEGLLASADERFVYLTKLEERCCREQDVGQNEGDKSKEARETHVLGHVSRQRLNILAQIASLPASTAAELAHKARVVATSMDTLWRTEDEDNMGVLDRLERAALRTLLDQMMAAGGLTRPILNEIAPAEILEHGYSGAPRTTASEA